MNLREPDWMHSQELASAYLEPNKEAQYKAVNSEGCKSDGNVDEGHCGGFYEGMIHRCLLMTQDNRAVSVQCRNFSHRPENDKQKGTNRGCGVRRGEV